MSYSEDCKNSVSPHVLTPYYWLIAHAGLTHSADMGHPPFLYGTHYSTPGYCLYFLVRKAPDYMLRLQSGQFDKPDRLFRSVEVRHVRVGQR